MLVLLVIPYLFYGLITSAIFRPMYKIGLYSFVLNFIFLTWLGGAVVEDPYILLGQIFSIYYFFFLLVLIPLISFIESFFFILIQKNKYNN